MSEYSFTYHDGGFRLENAADYTLYIKLGKTEFSFLIAEHGVLLAWKDQCDFTSLINTELTNILKAPYRKVVVGLVPDALTLLPMDLFSPESVVEYARYLDIKPNDKVFSVKLDADNQLIYKTDGAALTHLTAAVEMDNTTVPADRGWIAAIAETAPGNYALYADISCGQVSILNFNNGKVRYYNSFKADNIADILYFCIYAADQLDLKPAYTTLIVSGACNNADVDKLKQFFRTVSFNEAIVMKTPSFTGQTHQILSLAALA